MNYYFLAYIFLCIFIWITAVVRLSQLPRPVSSIIVAVLFLLIFIFYGTRWFYGSSITNNPNGSWPPVINMCPDYLVYYKWNGTDTCIDLSGVNRSNGKLLPWTQDDSFQNPPTNPDKYFQFVYKPGMTTTQIDTLCKQANDNGLSWEGITNGDNCTYYTSGSTGNRANGANCGASAPTS